MTFRSATSADVQAASVTLSEAFATDPVWGWAFPESAHQQVWWRFWVTGALPQDWVRIAEVEGGAGSVAVWIPPGGTECAREDEAHVEPLLRALVGDRAGDVLKAFKSFETNHPHDEPHYYLSLFGTADEQRGHGLGMALLADCLARIDDEHAAAYLESSNPVNLDRYESVGFRPRSEFPLPGGKGVVTTMWREPS